MIEPHKTVGYESAVRALKRVHRICGVGRVYAILARNGARSLSLRDLHPRYYPDVVIQCDAAVLCVRVWEGMLRVKKQVINPTNPDFKNAVDLWMTTCDLELRLISPDLYNDRGEPL